MRRKHPHLYAFTIEQEITLGKSCPIDIPNPWIGNAEVEPFSTLPIAIQMNAPCPGFIILNEISIGNQNLFHSEGTEREDAWCYMVNVELEDCPRITNTISFRVVGDYSGIVPHGYREGTKFLFRTILTYEQDGFDKSSEKRWLSCLRSVAIINTGMLVHSAEDIVTFTDKLYEACGNRFNK